MFDESAFALEPEVAEAPSPALSAVPSLVYSARPTSFYSPSICASSPPSSVYPSPAVSSAAVESPAIPILALPPTAAGAAGAYDKPPRSEPVAVPGASTSELKYSRKPSSTNAPTPVFGPSTPYQSRRRSYPAGQRAPSPPRATVSDMSVSVPRRVSSDSDPASSPAAATLRRAAQTCERAGCASSAGSSVGSSHSHSAFAAYLGSFMHPFSNSANPVAAPMGRRASAAPDLPTAPISNPASFSTVSPTTPMPKVAPAFDYAFPPISREASQSTIRGRSSRRGEGAVQRSRSPDRSKSRPRSRSPRSPRSPGSWTREARSPTSTLYEEDGEEDAAPSETDLEEEEERGRSRPSFEIDDRSRGRAVSKRFPSMPSFAPLSPSSKADAISHELERGLRAFSPFAFGS